MSADRYLTGNFAPVTEEVTVTSLRVTGRIPPELNGRYLRNGPNPLAVADAQRHHWFMGHGMVHGVCLAHGRAQWYRNRWIRSAELVEALGEDMAGRSLAAHIKEAGFEPEPVGALPMGTGQAFAPKAILKPRSSYRMLSKNRV